jgi:hypothetical protein
MQCDQIGRFFADFGCFLEARWDIFAPEKWQHFGLLFAQADVLQYHQNKHFSNHDQIGLFFAEFGCFLEAHWDIFDSRNGNILGYFLLKQMFYNFSKLISFQIMTRLGDFLPIFAGFWKLAGIFLTVEMATFWATFWLSRCFIISPKYD